VSGQHAVRVPWELPVILAFQAAFTIPLILHRAVYGDEALYIWAGHLEIDHWLHGRAIPALAGYFSGAPVVYPPLDALTGSLAGARLLSCCFMLGTTTLLWVTARHLRDRVTATAAAALFVTLYSTMHLGSFATFDAMSLFLLALAAFFAVKAAEGNQWWAAAAAAALITANAAKYASILWDPVVVCIAVLHKADSRPARTSVERGALIAACWAAAAAALLGLGGKPYLHGLMATTLSRAAGTEPALAVLWHAFQWVGAVVVLALAGLVCSIARHEPRSRIWLTGVLAAAGLLAPLNEARIHTLISLGKHVGFGAWFAAIAAGYAVSCALSWLAARFPRRALLAGSCAALAVPLLGVGAVQASATGGESHSAYLAERLRAMITRSHDQELILVDTPELTHLYPPLLPVSDWKVARGAHVLSSDLPLFTTNLGLIQDRKFTIIVLRFRGLVREQDLQYRSALQRTHAYRFTGTVSPSGGGAGRFFIWQLRSNGGEQ
jgi:hypothetical protein